MTRPKDDAYPNWYTEDQHGETGLSKLEYFAAQALAGLAANPELTEVVESQEEGFYSERLATLAVRHARALIAALNEPAGSA